MGEVASAGGRDALTTDLGPTEAHGGTFTPAKPWHHTNNAPPRPPPVPPGHSPTRAYRNIGIPRARSRTRLRRSDPTAPQEDESGNGAKGSTASLDASVAHTSAEEPYCRESELPPATQGVRRPDRRRRQSQ